MNAADEQVCVYSKYNLKNKLIFYVSFTEEVALKSFLLIISLICCNGFSNLYNNLYSLFLFIFVDEITIWAK